MERSIRGRKDRKGGSALEAEEWTQKEWMGIIHKCLLYLSQTDPPPLNLYKSEREVLPNWFIDKEQAHHFCYVFRGAFLPSGNSDGRVWKPSQGARPSGDGLMKRYFYYKEKNIKIKRQVIWLTHCDKWCFLDYRNNFKGKISLERIATPRDFDLKELVRLALANIKNIKAVPRHKRREKAAAVEEDDDDDEQEDDIDDEQKEESEEETVLKSIRSPSQGDGTIVVVSPPQCEGESPHTPSQYGAAYDVPLPEPISLFDNEYNSTYDASIGMNNLLPEIPTIDNSPNPLEEPLGSLNSSFEEPFSTPLDDLYPFDDDDLATPVYSLPSNGKKRKTPMDRPASPPPPQHTNFLYSPLDFLINHLLSYDQIVDLLSQSLCTQLVFNRETIQSTGLDSSALMQYITSSSYSGTVDLGEFPGRVVKNFFMWLYQSQVLRDVPDVSRSSPPVYCVICGKADVHDELLHYKFYNSMDKPFVDAMKTKALNMYDLVRELMRFLLKYPHSRKTFCNVIDEHLHCPWCSRKKGVHDRAKHNSWKRLIKDEYSHIPNVPDPSSNLDLYTKSTFEFLMFPMPYYIPSFLLKLNNVKTFLDCLVCVWKTIRLVV